VTSRPGLRSGRSILVRVALFSVLWLVLTEGDLRSPFIALLSIIAATATSLVLGPPADRASPHRSWGPAAMVRFLAFFMRESAHGGVDVARRALDPRLPLRPGYLHYRTRLPEGAGRVVLAGTISLLPGTLSTRLAGDALRIHVLDVALPAEETIRRLEGRVADLFGLPVPDGGTPPGVND
jgi:multicomponent Na+:H+ antiporter subunit E